MSLLLISLHIADAHAEIYYVDNLIGDDLNHGNTAGKPWKTLDKLNSFSFKPGDSVLLKKEQIWNETLIVSTSGTEKLPIIFSSYGSGSNPIIKTSVSYNDWKLIISKKNIKVWEGGIKGHKNHWSAMKNNRRVRVYFGYKTKGRQKLFTAPKRLVEMKNEFFYSPYNKDVFYYRSDDGNPGQFEIGALKYAIYIKDKSFVIVDGIDTFGPGGQVEKGGGQGSAHVVIESSDHIVIRNSMHSHNHNNGIRITDGSHHCTIDNIVSNGHRSTGIYLWEAGLGNKILNSEVFDCGSVISDTGDMGLIGVWETKASIIKGCYVHDNGHEHIDGMDAAISIVRGPGTSVIMNYVKNSGGTGIMVASDSDGSDISYNVVQNWGVMGNKFKANRHCAGIGVGGGPVNATVRNISIYNNLIINGGVCGENRAAIYIKKHDTSGLTIFNNIVFDNGLNYDFMADHYLSYPQWSLNKNILFNSRGSSIRLKKRVFSNDEILSALRFFSDEKLDAKNTIMAFPEIDLLNKTLLPNSIAIDNGVTINHKEDFNGNAVPQDGAYDIGPFEFIRSH